MFSENSARTQIPRFCPHFAPWQGRAGRAFLWTGRQRQLQLGFLTDPGGGGGGGKTALCQGTETPPARREVRGDGVTSQHPSNPGGSARLQQEEKHAGFRKEQTSSGAKGGAGSTPTPPAPTKYRSNITYFGTRALPRIGTVFVRLEGKTSPNTPHGFIPFATETPSRSARRLGKVVS